MAKKISRKSIKNIVAAIIVTAIVFAAAFYLYGNWAGYNEGFEAGSAGVAPAAVTVEAASIHATLNATTFDHSSTVASDGSVSSSTSVTLTLWINNTDDDIVAQDIYLRLMNPRTDNEGLHDNLETDSFEFGITEGGTTTKLFHDGEYVEDGWYYGDLTEGGSVQITVTCTLESAVAGTFQDGQTYDCSLYAYQSKANYPTAVSFYVTT